MVLAWLEDKEPIEDVAEDVGNCKADDGAKERVQGADAMAHRFDRQA